MPDAAHYKLGFMIIMGRLLWFVVAALAVDVVLLGAILVRRLCVAPTTALLLDLGPLIIAAGVLVALLTFTFNLRRGRSEDLLKAATELSEKAYQLLAPTAGSDQPPNDRRSWLSAARLIRTAEKLGAPITEDSHRLIYQEKREYWRTRLYELIVPSIDGFPSSFYAEKPEHMIGYSGRVRAPLSEKSLAFLYRFVRWHEGLADPIGEEPNFSDEEVERMRSFGPHGLGNLLAEVRRLQRQSSKK